MKLALHDSRHYPSLYFLPGRLRVPGQEKAKFPISVASKTVGFVPVWVAWRMGYFDREGLAVDLVLMRGAEKAAMALVGESVNVAVGSADAFISAVESNFNVAITAGIINRPSFFIMAKKNYKTFQDLRGATIGVTNISSGPAVALRYVLKAKGLEYPRDYKLQPAGPDAERTMGMSAGRIDASPLAVPFNFVAEELGFHAVGSYLEVIPDYQVSVFAVNRGWAERNRRQLVQFKRGMVRAMRWFFENRDAAVDFVAKELKLKPEYARKGYEFYKEKGLWDAQYQHQYRRNEDDHRHLQRNQPAEAGDGTREVHRSKLFVRGVEGNRSPITHVSFSLKVRP